MSELSVNKERIYFWDYMKALAIIMVILNHSIGNKTSFAFVYVIRMAVPIFLVISGVTFSMSFERIRSVREWYAPHRLLKKLLYFSLPAVGVCVLYILLNSANPQDWLSAFVLAKYGQGAYYYNILVQLIIIFPIIYLCVNKMWGGYGIVTLINIAYEVVLRILQIDVSFYRVLFGRYMLIVALGILLGTGKKISRRWLICMFAAGAIWILLFKTAPKGWFAYYPWENTNMLCGLYVFPVLYLLHKKFGTHKIDNKLFHYVLEQIGKNTYFILITQMIWFWKCADIYSAAVVPKLPQILINVSLTCGVGCVVGFLYNKAFAMVWSKALFAVKNYGVKRM